MTFKYKFRCWEPDAKMMLYDVGLTVHGEFYWKQDKDTTIFIPQKYGMQYTGINDKNDTPIYQSDIVRANLEFGDENSIAKTVVSIDNLLFGDSWFQYNEYSNHNIDIDTIEVIGNTWEDNLLLLMENV
jgi:hypothetical protein